MDTKLDIVQGARNLSVEAGSGNNGLGKTVRDLEQIYTNANFLQICIRRSASVRADKVLQAN